MTTNRAAIPARWGGLLALGLPVGVSLAVHALILLLMIGVAWTVRPARRAQRPLGAEFAIAAIPPPPLTLPSDSPTPSETPVEPTPTPPAPPQEETPLLSGLSTDPGPAPALRSAADSPLNTLLRPAEPQPATATFAGVGARKAQSVVYVVDASGAMVTNLKWVLEEVERSIVALKPTQSFQVVLFRDRTVSSGAGPFELFRPDAGLLPASAANKAAVAAWLATVQPVGRSNPLDGLRRALRFRPDAVFLLSRGLPRTEGERSTGDWSGGPQAILQELDDLNPGTGGPGGRRDAVIKTIQFLEDDPTGTMQAIAEQHGDGEGSYAVLRLEHLGRPR